MEKEALQFDMNLRFQFVGHRDSHFNSMALLDSCNFWTKVYWKWSRRFSSAQSIVVDEPNFIASVFEYQNCSSSHLLLLWHASQHLLQWKGKRSPSGRMEKSIRIHLAKKKTRRREGRGKAKDQLRSSSDALSTDSSLISLVHRSHHLPLRLVLEHGQNELRTRLSGGTGHVRAKMDWKWIYAKRSLKCWLLCHVVSMQPRIMDKTGSIYGTPPQLKKRKWRRSFAEGSGSSDLC